MERTQMKLMQIGEVSRLSGLPVRTVHYYEDRGLLEPASRTEAGYQLYGREELARLSFISRAKLLGLTLEETRKLVGLAAGCNRGEIVPDLEETLREKLRETDRKMEELAAFKENLLYYQRRLTGTGPEELCGDEVSFCGCVDAVTDTASGDRKCSSAPT